jgi:glutaryl-CoA dehydrogenase
VPDDNRLALAKSFRDTGRVLATTRSTCAWMALGHATAGYDAALSYAKQRVQFGKPLVSFQIVQQRLVRMLAELTGMQLYCMQIGRLAEAGKLGPTVAGLAKMNHVIRHMADIEAIHTFEGTETMQTLIVGRDITGTAAFA